MRTIAYLVVDRVSPTMSARFEQHVRFVSRSTPPLPVVTDRLSSMRHLPPAAHRPNTLWSQCAKALLLLVLMAGLTRAGRVARERADANLEHTGNGYVFDLRFSSPLPSDTLLRLLNDTNTVKKITAFIDSVHIRVIDSVTYEVYSEFGHLGYHGKSSFLRRTLYEHDSIAVTLQYFRHNWSVIPEVVDAGASYRIRTSDGVSQVHFSQSVTLSRSVGRLYMRMVRWQLGKFADRLFEDVLVPAEERWRRRRQESLEKDTTGTTNPSPATPTRPKALHG
ncbi:MAG: hypothetical protein GF331_13345 [Chitinivibrionales bacterium]|nr:hypothetical protein [Chitinivibrionales bacterium]